MSGWLGRQGLWGNIIDNVTGEPGQALLKTVALRKWLFALVREPSFVAPEVRLEDEGILLLKQTCGKLLWILRVQSMPAEQSKVHV